MFTRDDPLPILTDEELESPIGLPGDPPAICGYELGGEIGRGGQGVVHRATQLSTGAAVAIKVLPGGHFADPRARARFAREARILSRLSLPNVVCALGHGRTPDGSLYLVLPYVEGPALDEHAATLTGDAAIALLFARVAECVHAVHVEGVLHRDLKPANVRVAADGEPRVLDFGLASSSVAGDSSRSLTAPGQVLGSLPWASPEQVRGDVDAVDARSDVYALGLMLCRAIADGHRPPYPTDGPADEVVARIRHARPRVAGRHPLDPMAAIALRCLAKRPDDRYQTALLLAADLRRVSAGGGPALRRRRRWPLVAGACAALAAAVALVRPSPPVPPMAPHGPATPSRQQVWPSVGPAAAVAAGADGRLVWVSIAEVDCAHLAATLRRPLLVPNGPAQATYADALQFCARASTGSVAYRLPTAAELRWLHDHRLDAARPFADLPSVLTEWSSIPPSGRPPPATPLRPFRLVMSGR